MFSWKTLSVMAGLMIPASAIAAPTVVGPIQDPYGNDTLYVIAQGSWSADQALARTMGGNLMTIHSAVENTFVLNSIAKDFSASGGPNLSAVPLWIGYFDPTGAVSNDGSGAQHAANFIWADGSPSTFTSWNTATSEPNNSMGAEYYAAFNWHQAIGTGPVGTWNDTPNAGTSGYGGNTDGPYYGIVAVVPEPASIAGLMIGGAALLARRRSVLR